MPHLAAAAAAAASKDGSSGGQPPAAGSSGSTAADGGSAAAAAAAVAAAAEAGINRTTSAGAALGSSPGDSGSSSSSSNAAAAEGPCKDTALEGHASGDEAEVEGFGEGDFEMFYEEPETMHRLCPTYASDINSPLRHVRTRIYFTSESHMHSLVNLLRFCNLRSTLMNSSSSAANAASRRSSMDATSAATSAAAAAAAATAVAAAAAAAAETATAAEGVKATRSNSGSSSSTNHTQPPQQEQQQQQQQQQGLARCATPPGPLPDPLLSDQGLGLLSKTTELDYLTQLVFRLYENMSVPSNHPQRFKLEILFSPGASYDPTEVQWGGFRGGIRVWWEGGGQHVVVVGGGRVWVRWGQGQCSRTVCGWAV